MNSQAEQKSAGAVASIVRPSHEVQPIRSRLRVLIIEDSEDDATLLVREFRRGGYDPSYLRVDTADAFTEALLSQQWDVVFADYSMPSFSAVAAMQILQETALDLPFIIVSGTIGEDLAAQAVKSGADDYIIKGNLCRLLPSMDRALREAELRSANRQGDEALRTSEARKSAILESSLDSIISIDTQGRVTEWNGAAERCFGYTREEAIGRNMVELIMPPRFREQHEIGLSLYQEAGQGQIIGKRVELCARRKDGSEFPAELAFTACRVGHSLEFTAYLREITDRKVAEHALRESQELYLATFHEAPVGIAHVGLDGRFLQANTRLSSIFGYSHEELLGMSLNDIKPSGDLTIDLAAILEALAGNRGAYSIERRYLRKDANSVWVHLTFSILPQESGELKYLILVVEDISHRKLLEEQVRQGQKMEAIGRLAGGIAHDFNNLMTAVLGYSHLLLMQLQPGDSGRAEVEQIKKAGERATTLTRQLLAFSRKQLLQAKRIDLNAIVSDMDRLLRRLIGEDVCLVTCLDPDLRGVVGDPSQIEQVLMNLVVNARDAMPLGGCLTIETANVEFDESYVLDHSGAERGRYAMLAVTDDGAGMDSETMAHIFEPFFTTKEVGKGTGLGLSTVYGIVKQSGGYIWVYSEPGQGTTFKIYLPVAEPENPLEERAPVSAVSNTGTETILLVEDEDMLRQLIRDVLSMSGYTVIEAADGERALEAYKNHSADIHMLVTDVVMPRISGPQLAERLSEIYPDLKVLFMSGYTDRAIELKNASGADRAFLQKPFTPSALASKVREVLDS